MDIKELINGLLDFNQNYEALCAENKELIAENKALKEKIDFITKNSKKASLDNVAKVALKNGESKLLKRGICEWVVLEVEYDATKKTFLSPCYQSWLKEKVYRDGIPETVSYNAFITYFSKELHAMYDEERAEGIRLLKKGMKEVKEKENK